jgi:hypothetical protein
MVEHEAPTLLEGLAPVVRIGEAVIRPRDDVERAGLRGALEEPPPVDGRDHLVAIGLDDQHPGHACGRLGPVAAKNLGDEGPARLLGVRAGQLAQ